VTFCTWCASIVLDRFAVIAQKRLRACEVKRLESGQWIFVYASVLSTNFTPIEIDMPQPHTLPPAPERKYQPTSGATHDFAIRVLNDSIKNYGPQSDHICGIRFYPRNDADWRAAIEYLKINWLITSEPTIGTYSTPLYSTVAGLLKDVTARRCPSPTVIDGRAVVTQPQ
jgi:hypothetical protein